MKTMLAGLLASLVLTAAPAAHAAQLLVNGGFESGLSGWTVGLDTSVIDETSTNRVVQFLRPSTGSRWGKASLSQSFETEVGATYDISFRGGVFGASARDTWVRMATMVGEEWVTTDVGTFSLAPALNASGFSNFSWAFEGTGGVHTLIFEAATARGVALVLDDISIVERVMVPDLSSWVPEPSTWAMMILGFGAIGASLRNRRRRLA